jgi:hypothetical protein
LKAAACAIHAAYCKHFIEVGYDTFRDSWQKAAAFAQECNADPEWFVEAQKVRSCDLDPEDLELPSTMEVFRQAERELARDLIDGFRYSVITYNDDLRTGSDLVGRLRAVLLPYQAAFRVVYAKLICVADDAARVIEIHGKPAAKEIRSSKLFRDFIHSKYPQLDIAAFLEELDRVSGAWWASLEEQQEGK